MPRRRGLAKKVMEWKRRKKTFENENVLPFAIKYCLVLTNWHYACVSSLVELIMIWFYKKPNLLQNLQKIRKINIVINNLIRIADARIKKKTALSLLTQSFWGSVIPGTMYVHQARFRINAQDIKSGHSLPYHNSGIAELRTIKSPAGSKFAFDAGPVGGLNLFHLPPFTRYG